MIRSDSVLEIWPGTSSFNSLLHSTVDFYLDFLAVRMLAMRIHKFSYITVLQYN